jgi:hypothetical protein
VVVDDAAPRCQIGSGGARTPRQACRQHRNTPFSYFGLRLTGLFWLTSAFRQTPNNLPGQEYRLVYGFRAYEAIEIALYHTLGDLPEPDFTHELC